VTLHLLRRKGRRRLCWAICLSPKGGQNSCEIGYGEIVLSIFIFTTRLSAVSISGPTSNYELRSASSLAKSTYVVDFTPVYFTCRCARDLGEASKEPLSKDADRIGRESSALVDLAAACSDEKLREIFTLARLGAFTLYRESAA
jgi:hypothetical protein